MTVKLICSMYTGINMLRISFKQLLTHLTHMHAPEVQADIVQFGMWSATLHS